jgi:formylmethanofuran dehydrogenase subunit E
MPDLPPSELFDRIYRRHGHRCPMSTLGGRLGWAALRAIGGIEGMQVVYLIQTCAADGIREATGCSEDDGTFRIENRGEHRLLLNAAAGEGVEVSLTEAALGVAWRYRLCSEALDRDRPRLSGEELVAREAERESVLQSVLEELWILPDETLLHLRPLFDTEVTGA